MASKAKKAVCAVQWADLPASGRFSFLSGLYSGIELFPVPSNNGIELLLDFPQKARGIDAREVPIHVLVNDFDER